MFQRPNMRVLKFITAGCVGVTVNLSVLYALVSYAGMHYLIGSVLAFSCSNIVGFSLQKYWTFRERTHRAAPRQFLLYSAVALGNIALNTLVVYLTVGVLGVHYLLGQIAGSALIACMSFFIYRNFLFVRPVADS